MAPLYLRRRRRFASGIVRGLALLGLVSVAAFTGSRALRGRSGAATGGAGDGGGRSLTETLLSDNFFATNTSIADELASVGNLLLHPPGGAHVDSSAARKGCLPHTWTGNVADYNLTRAAVACVAAPDTGSDGVVMVTWANYHYLDFAKNWISHLRELNATSFMVGAMDNKLLEALAWQGVPTFSMDSGLTTGDFGWGSATFHKMGREKIGLINTFTAMNFSILVSDIDTVWMKDPLPYMAQYPQADVLTSSDHLTATETDGGLENPREAGSPANIGLMLVRAHANAFAKEWLEAILADDNLWDQNAFNELMRRGAVWDPPREDRLFMGYDGRFKFGILPVSTFCSGHTFFTQRMPEKLGLEPYVAHATYQYSGTVGKRHRFREALLWNDEPGYFEGRFLAYTPNIPSEMLRRAVPPHRDHPMQTQEHIAPQFELIHHQMRQLRSAWGIAQSLNRTLVLPEFWSGQDRYWAPHNGVLPGSQLELPFLAPADHILELEYWARDTRPEDEVGPAMDFREYSFLQNKRMPAEVRRDRVRVRVCRPEDDPQPCSDGQQPAGEVFCFLLQHRGWVQLKQGLTDAQIITALEGYSDRSIMVFDTMLGAFGGFKDDAVTQRFQNRLKEYASLFCCIDEQPRGNVFYDFLFDTVPHTDRFGRTFDGNWEMRMGP